MIEVTNIATTAVNEGSGEYGFRGDTMRDEWGQYNIDAGSNSYLGRVEITLQDRDGNPYVAQGYFAFVGPSMHVVTVSRFDDSPYALAALTGFSFALTIVITVFVVLLVVRRFRRMGEALRSGSFR